MPTLLTTLVSRGDTWQVYPPMGRVPPNGQLPLEFTFAPPKRPPPPKGFVAGEETEDITEDISSSVNFEILETQQKVRAATATRSPRHR